MQALLFQLVGRETLPSAVAANSTIVSVSRLVGPALGGVAGRRPQGSPRASTPTPSRTSSSLVALASIDRAPDRPPPRPPDRGRHPREAVAHVRHRPDVRRPLVVMAVIGLVVAQLPDHVPVDGPLRVRAAAPVRSGLAMSVERDRVDRRRDLRRRHHARPSPHARTRARRRSAHRARGVRRGAQLPRVRAARASRSGSPQRASSPSTRSPCSRRPSRRCRVA